jgi:hypothetical protein
MSEYKKVEICESCGTLMTDGDFCFSCEKISKSNSSISFAKYACAVKDAVGCWQKADCDEHKELCQSVTKEVAKKILDLNTKIEMLEKGIRKHKQMKQGSDDIDKELWNLIS